jgi:hypothetical protein
MNNFVTSFHAKEFSCVESEFVTAFEFNSESKSSFSLKNYERITPVSVINHAFPVLI